MVKMGTVWDRTAEFLSDNIGAVVPIALLTYFVPSSIEGNFEAAMTGAGPGIVALLRIVQLAFAILSLWGTLTITAMALDIAGDRSAASIATRRLVPVLIVSVVMVAIVCLLALPIPIMLVASGYDVAAMARGEVAMSMQAGGGIALYGLVLLCVLLWGAARLIVTTPVLVREDRMLGALARSWSLTRGLALRIIGVIILFVLVSWVAQLAAQTVFGSVFALVAGGEHEGVSLSGVMTSIVVAAVQAAFLVIPPVFTAKLYLALTARVGMHPSAAAA